MSNVEKKVSVSVILKGAEKAAKEIRAFQQAVEDAAQTGTSLDDALGGITKHSRDAEKAVEKVRSGVSSLGSQMKTGAKDTQKYAEGFGELIKVSKEASDALRNAAQAAVVGGSRNPVDSAIASQKLTLDQAREHIAVEEARSATILQASRKVVSAHEQEVAAKKKVEKATQELQAQEARSSQTRQDTLRRMGTDTSATGMGAFFQGQKKATTELDEATQKLGTNTDGVAQGSLPRLRYALYDVSTTLAIAGGAMLGLATATAAVSIKMDRQFADVLRTTESYMDSTGQAGRRLRDDFNDLFTSLPTSWDALSEIGTLAGQLGVAQQDVAEFTELVAKFGATSDVSIETAATAFGRLSELLDVPAAKYENLGSSILSVGIASVATEGQIINTTTQLASIGNFAGLSADEVIGLSSALASLGTQPELSRGTMTRLFTKISEAVSEGGEKLAGFASAAQMSSSEFAKAWNNEPIKAIEGIFHGLGTQGDQAVATLKELGITSSRDIPTLLRLGQNAELVSEQIAIAGQGFAEGTALQDQYGVIAETVSAKLEVMKNSVTNLFSTLGEGANAIGPVLDMITGIINALNRFIDNPVGKAIAGIVIGFTALAGVLALVIGGAARGAASMAAMATAMHEFTKANIGATLSVRGLMTQMNALGVSTRVTTGAVHGLKAALISTGIGAVFVAIGTALSFLNREASHLDGIKDAMGGLGAAVAEDTRAYKDADKAAKELYTTHTIAVDKVDEVAGATVDASEAAGVWVGAQEEVRDRTAEATDEISEQTIAFGENAIAAIQAALAGSEAIQELARDPAARGYLEQAGFDWGEAIQAGLEGGTEGIDEYHQQIADSFQETFAGALAPGELNAVLYALDTVFDSLYAISGSIDAELELAEALEFVGGAAGIAGEGAEYAADEFEDLGSEADIATAALKEFMEMAFGAANAEIAMNQAMSNLGASLHENGNAFDTFSQGGQANIQALQVAFQAAGENAVQSGYSYEVGIQTVAQAMVQAGVISVQQLEALGVQSTNFGNNLLSIAEATSQAVAALQGQMAALRAADSGLTRGQAADGLRYAGQALDVINRGGGQAETAIRSMGIEFDRLKPPASAVNALVDQLGQGWDNADQKARKAGGSGSKAAKGTGKAAKDAAKEVRTLSDYVSDLGSVMSAAFDFRFGFQDSKDSTLSAFRDIRKSFEDARIRARDLRLEIRDLKAEMQQGRADINVLSYQLTVAQEYGDTLREEQIRAELAKATSDLAKQNADLTDKQKDLNKAVKDGTPDVTSNTEAAIAQRGAVTDLIGQYQKQIEQYAATGASQKQVENYSKQLTRQFEAQMHQLGYSREEVRKYGLSLKDFTEIIKAVPRNLTVSVSTSTSAAEKAIQEFTAKKRSTSVGVNTPSASTMNSRGKAAGTNYGKGFGSISLPKPKVPQPDPVRIRFQMPTYSQMMKMQEHIRKITNNPSFRIALPGGQGGQTFADGGYTGRGGKYDPAGIVHRGEYVVKKELVDQRTGLPKADAFGQLVAGTPTPAPSYANGGFVSGIQDGGMVELGPASLRYLANNLNFQVDIDGKKITAVVNENNRQASVRGVR